MKWRKKGRVYVPDGSKWWAKKYAFPPTPYFLNDEVIRIYVAFCDENIVGRIGFVDVSAANPAEVLQVSEEPVLDIGTPGAFDENGILPTSIVEVDDKLYLYYVGYQLGMKVRYYQFEGLAISDDGGNSFKRRLRVPVTDRSDAELLNRTSAFVRRRNGLFEMWYVGGSEWTTVAGKPLPMYNIKYLTSADGINWGPEGRVCIDYESDDEHAFGKPFVLEEGGLHKMFYSVRTRSKGYRLGYAESEDGLNWTRKDEVVGIDVSESGWDSKMIAYASIVRYKDSVYMFYNGNNLGETGFGYAILEQR
jgi:predicted GH43/DUF377 family glycosyl hydrolase